MFSGSQVMKRWLINEQTDATKKKIAEEGIYLYATHAPEWEHNKKMLKKLNELEPCLDPARRR